MDFGIAVVPKDSPLVSPAQIQRHLQAGAEADLLLRSDHGSKRPPEKRVADGNAAIPVGTIGVAGQLAERVGARGVWVRFLGGRDGHRRGNSFSLRKVMLKK